MKLRKTSLTFKLVSYFSLLSLVTITSVGALTFVKVRNTIETLVFDRLEATASLKETTLNLWFDSQKETVISLANQPEVQAKINNLINSPQSQINNQISSQKLQEIFDLNLHNRSGLNKILILRKSDGKVIFSTDTTEISTFKNKETYFLNGQQQTWIKNLTISPENQQPLMIISTPIKNQNLEVTGILVAYLDLKQMQENVLDNTDSDPDIKTYLIEPNNQLISAQKEQLKIVNSLGIDSAIKRQEGQAIYLNHQGLKVIGVYRWLNHRNLALLLEIPQQKALAPAHQLAWIILIIGLISSLLLSWSISLIARYLNKPILNLAEVAKQIAQGELEKVKPLRVSNDELGLLADAFNQMIEELKLLHQEFENQVNQLELAEISAHQSYHELQTEKEKVDLIMEQLSNANEEICILNERLKNENLDLAEELKIINQRLIQFLEAIPVGVIVFDASGSSYYANQRAQELLGKIISENSEVTGSQIIETYPIYIAGSNGLYPSDKMLGIQALTLGKSSNHDDMEIHQPDRIIPIETWETPIFDKHGNIAYAIVAFQDITERKRAELALLKLNQANERFVPREFLNLLHKQSIIDVELGNNVQKELSILFADIRGFTSLSEQMTPEDNFRFINAFLSRMEPSIREHKGFIDKYIGDGLMALFSGSADDALQASISMLKRLAEYNKTRQRPGRPPLQIGIGINTGLTMLGTVGGFNRMEGTVISDAVNLAARLENLTKVYGVSLLISHHTFLRLEDANDYQFRLIDRVTVKGKSKAVSVYEIFDADPPEIKLAKLNTKTIFEQGLLLYNQEKIQEAESLFQECLKVNPEDSVTQIYLERCQQFWKITRNILNDVY
jgi:PAS domain S-box-containing protein